jgi:hypothetical protein
MEERRYDLFWRILAPVAEQKRETSRWICGMEVGQEKEKAKSSAKAYVVLCSILDVRKINGSTRRRKSSGERGSPCLTPEWTGMGLERLREKVGKVKSEWKRPLIVFRSQVGMWMWERIAKRESWLTLSKAFSKSRKSKKWRRSCSLAE